MAEATAAAIAPETDVEAVENVKEQLEHMKMVNAPFHLVVLSLIRMYKHAVPIMAPTS